MRKTIFAIIFIFIFFFAQVPSQSTINISKTQQLSLTLNFSSPIITQDDDFSKIIQMNTNATMIQPGYYIIPKEIKQFTFPQHTKIYDITIQAQNISKKHINSNPPIAPTPIPLFLSQSLNTSIQTISPKAFDSWYNYHIGHGIIHEKQSLILTIELYPVLYQSEQQMIQWADEFTITIDYEEPIIETDQNKIENYELLILTPSQYHFTLQPFVTHKNLMNISTQLVTLEEIYQGTYTDVIGRDEAEQIKYFIKYAIETWDISSVLLIGSADTFPTRDTHINVGGFDKEIFVSDLYYADIYNETQDFCSWDSNNNQLYAEYDWNGETDELDLYPDVHIGRLPCVSETELSTVLNKIIAYENGEYYKQHWFSNLIVIGGDSFPGDDDQIAEGEFVNSYIMEMMDGFKSINIWASNGQLSSITPTGLEIITETINAGAGFVDFSGHGNTYKFATHPFNKDNIWLPTPYSGYSNNHIQTLENNDKLPIIITGACSVSKFNKDDDCFSWSFLTNPSGGGIASFGSTGLGYAYTGKYITYGLVEKMATDMFKAYDSNYVKTLGEMWTWGLFRNIDSHMDATEYKTIEEWQLFGDPTLKIAEDTHPPARPTLTGPSSIKVKRTYSFESTSTDNDGDTLYYLFDWDDGQYSSWIGPKNSGELVTASHQWNETGEYEIRVAVKDNQGMHSDWSTPLPISITKKSSWLINWLLNLFSQTNLSELLDSYDEIIK